MIRPLWNDLAAAFGLLTRIPVPHAARAPSSREVWAYPVVGAVVGAAGGAIFAVTFSVGMPPSLGALFAITATILLTGGLHEDGLADTADGFGGGATRDKILEIMRDSRIGAFGALALMLSTAIRVTALASLSPPLAVFVAMVLAGTAGRAAIVMVLWTLLPARSDGMAAGMGRPRTIAPCVALALPLAGFFTMLPARAAIAACLAVAGTDLAVGGLARKRIGGYTGDVLGAVEVLVECAVLTVCASA